MRILALFIYVFCCITVSAQETPVPPPSPFTPTAVEVSASDGLTLKGDFYLLDTTKPTALLLHQLYANRTLWNGLDAALLGAGFNVLAVDLRGYGETGGDINWKQALTDVQTWIDWLRNSGVDANKIIPIGSSMGSVLAVAGCGNDSMCPTAIAISPGWEYYRIGVGNALKNQMTSRKILVIYAERDRYPALGVPKMLETAPDVVSVLKFEGNAHGLDLISKQADTIFANIIAWLGSY